jgi:hypothetical protein
MNLTSEDCRERPLLIARPRARTISRPAKRASARDCAKLRCLSIGGTPTTNQACLLGDRFDVVECDASVVAF